MASASEINCQRKQLYEKQKIHLETTMETNNSFEQEIKKIRLDNRETTQNMTLAQLTAYYKQSTDAEIKEHGFRVVSSTGTAVGSTSEALPVM